jgi:hypothetical protein
LITTASGVAESEGAAVSAVGSAVGAAVGSGAVVGGPAVVGCGADVGSSADPQATASATIRITKRATGLLNKWINVMGDFLLLLAALNFVCAIPPCIANTSGISQ